MNLADSIDSAREFKASSARDGQDMPSLMLVSDEKGVQLVAVGGNHHPAVETMLVGGQMLGVVPGAIELVMVSDAYASTIPNGDGRPEPGEYQRRWAEGDRDGITECLMHVRAWREDGEVKVELVQDPYVEVDGVVQFEDKENNKEPSSIEGRIPDALRMAFEAPSLFDDMKEPPEIPGIAPERAKEMIALAFIVALAGQGGGGVLVPIKPDEEEAFTKLANITSDELSNLFQLAWNLAEEVA